MDTEKIDNWYFTFLSTHKHPYGYVKMEKMAYMDARRLMFSFYGDKWDTMYSEENFLKHKNNVKRIYDIGLFEIQHT